MSLASRVRALPTLPLLLATALLLHGGSSTGADPRAQVVTVRPAAERAVAKDFTLKDLTGKDVKLSQFKGKVVLIDCWATWCGPCRMGIPDLIELQKTYQKQGFEVLGLSIDKQGATVVKPFAQQAGINYTMLVGGESVAATWVPDGRIPTTWMIDKQGRVVQKYLGLTQKAQFEAVIAQLLKE